MITKVMAIIIFMALVSDLIICMRKWDKRWVKIVLIIKAVILQCAMLGSALVWRDIISQRLMGWVVIIYLIVNVSQMIYLSITIFSKKRIAQIVGISLMSIALLIGFYGVTIGRLSIRKEYVEIDNSRTSSILNGLKVIQISDLHLGTYSEGSRFVARLVDVINSEQPDIIAFTGDIVNNSGDEIVPFLDDLARLKASIGVFAVLGNHDYGDYDRSLSRQQKDAILNRLKSNYEMMGWRLLDNSSEQIEVNGGSIDIIGVGHMGGRSYGDLPTAMKNVDSATYNLLLCHTPERWSSDIVGVYPIDLTLSGHTHAMQSKVNVFGKSYSLSAWLFAEWSGLYQSGESHLYVNDGVGCVGIPMRIGVRPEVTIFEFKDI